MGSPEDEAGRFSNEGPQRTVTVHSFAAGKFEVTFGQWDACVEAGACSQRPGDHGWGRGTRPVVNVNWHDAQGYVKWLSGKTGQTYRLLSETEWEYAARAGTSTTFFFGPNIAQGKANCFLCGSQWDSKLTAPVGKFVANSYGLHDMHGNVCEWVQDAWHNDYSGAPIDGSAWMSGGDQTKRVVRGGSWGLIPQFLRSASRSFAATGDRNSNTGFRVARTL